MADAIVSCLQESSSNGRPCDVSSRAAATFVIALLPRQASGPMQRHSLDQPAAPYDAPTLADEANAPARAMDVGAKLCAALAAQIRHRLTTATAGEKPPQRRARAVLVAAMTALLGASQSAKAEALRVGLLPLVLRHIGEVHTSLCVESSARKSQGELQELLSFLRLLQNLLLKNLAGKLACLQTNFARTLQNLWPTCLLDGRLRLAWLQTFTNFCVHCPDAKRSVKPLLPRICQLVLGPKPSGALLRSCLAALGSTGGVGPCRTVLWKEGVLKFCVDLTATCKDVVARRQALSLVYQLSFLENHPAVASTALPLYGKVLEQGGDQACVALAKRGVAQLAALYPAQVKKRLLASKAVWRARVATAAGIEL